MITLAQIYAYNYFLYSRKYKTTRWECIYLTFSQVLMIELKLLIQYIQFLRYFVRFIMELQQELNLEEVIQSQEKHIEIGKTQYNSRFSHSYYDPDSLIDIDEQQELQFDQIYFCIIEKTPTLDPNQRQRMSTRFVTHQQEQVSNSDEIQIEQKNREQSSPQEIPLIPQIRLSNTQKLMPVIQEQITAMVIVTSDYEIEHVKVYLQGSNENEEITNFQEQYRYKKKWINICIIKVNLEEYKSLVIRYRQIMKTLLVFSSKMEKQINFREGMIHQKIGLLFPQLSQENPDEQLINFCIIAAQQHISKRIKELIGISPVIIGQFYDFLRRYFRPNHLSIQLSKANIYGTEFFLYFIFQIYREDAINKLYEYELFNKLTISRNCSKVISTKYYQLFINGECFKEFLLYAYFLIAITNEPKNHQLIKYIAKFNVLYQSPLRTSIILKKLQSLNENFLAFIMISRRTNANIICNRQIGFEQYFVLRLKASRQIIKKEEKDYQCDYKTISTRIVQFFADIVLKSKYNLPKNHQFLDKYRQMIKQVFVGKKDLKVTRGDFAKMYANIKFLCKIDQKMGYFLIDCLASNIFRVIPNLLLTNYESIIHVLILKPQLEQQNKILIDFFQKQAVSSSQIIFLLKIWLQMKSQLYNYLTIQFILLKFIALNRYFEKIDVGDLMAAIADFMSKQTLTVRRKKQIWMFCDRIKKEMKDHTNRQTFQRWQLTIFSGQF